MRYFPPPVPLATLKYLETPLKLFSDMAEKTFGGIEQFAALNLDLARETLDRSQLAARQFIAMRQPQEFLSLLRSQIQPTAQKAVL